MFLFIIFHVIFLCKQKTAYEMRISDWSSDVCSSDLATNPFISLYLVQVALGAVLLDRWSIWGIVFVSALCAGLLALHYRQIGRASCRERVCQFVYISGVAVPSKKKKLLVASA